MPEEVKGDAAQRYGWNRPQRVLDVRESLLDAEGYEDDPCRAPTCW